MNTEPTEEQVKEYCRKRCLVVVSSELFNEMKARWGRDNTKHGHWIYKEADYSEADAFYEETDYPVADAFVVCSECGWSPGFEINNYCPYCGAKMDGVK